MTPNKVVDKGTSSAILDSVTVSSVLDSVARASSEKVVATGYDCLSGSERDVRERVVHIPVKDCVCDVHVTVNGCEHDECENDAHVLVMVDECEF